MKKQLASNYQHFPILRCPWARLLTQAAPVELRSSEQIRLWLYWQLWGVNVIRKFMKKWGFRLLLLNKGSNKQMLSGIGWHLWCHQYARTCTSSSHHSCTTCTRKRNARRDWAGWTEVRGRKRAQDCERSKKAQISLMKGCKRSNKAKGQLRCRQWISLRLYPLVFVLFVCLFLVWGRPLALTK